MPDGKPRSRAFNSLYTVPRFLPLTLPCRALRVRALGSMSVSGQFLVMESARNSRRKPESLARLKAAARKLFVERGYDATRPQDIARAAGLGHGTFYLHYPDKRACFLAFIAEARRELDDHVQ